MSSMEPSSAGPPKEVFNVLEDILLQAYAVLDLSGLEQGLGHVPFGQMVDVIHQDTDGAVLVFFQRDPEIGL